MPQRKLSKKQQAELYKLFVGEPPPGYVSPADSLKLRSQELLNRSRELSIQESMQKLAGPGYDPGIDRTQIPLEGGGFTRLKDAPTTAQELEERNVLIRGGGGPVTRPDSSLFYPATALSKKPAPEKEFDPTEAVFRMKFEAPIEDGKIVYKVDGEIVTKADFDFFKALDKEEAKGKREYIDKQARKRKQAIKKEHARKWHPPLVRPGRKKLTKPTKKGVVVIDFD